METILVVEDNNEIRSEICDIFKMENYNVLEASNGLEGFIQATNKLPDIIISDIMMPVLDGFKMYNELKNNELTSTIPIIFLSALSSNEDIRKGMNYGADDYLTKPINPNDLIMATNGKLIKYSKIQENFEDMKISITGVLHHELKTPLNGIIGFSDFLKTRVDEIPKREIKQIAENIYNSGIRLNKLAHKYLCFSDLKIKYTKLSEIKKMRNCQYIETSKIIYDVINSELCKERINDIKISIYSVELKIEQNLFKIIIEELIENALKFTKPGDKIEIESIFDNKEFIIKVKNNGKGMTPNQIKSINDFSQFDKKSYAQNGSGIGLSIVKLIMKIYQGSFKIESVPGMFLIAKLIFNNSFKT